MPVPEEALSSAGLLWLHVLQPQSTAAAAGCSIPALPEGMVLCSLPLLVLPGACSLDVRQLLADMRGLQQQGAGDQQPDDAQGMQQAQLQFNSFVADLALLVDCCAAPAAEEGAAAGSSASPEAAAAAEVAPAVCQLLAARGIWACCRLLDPGFQPPAEAAAASSCGSSSSRQGQLRGGSAQGALALSSTASSPPSPAAAAAAPAAAGLLGAPPPAHAAAAPGAAAGSPPPLPPSQGPCLSLLRGFRPASTEARYLAFKQRRYAFLDACSATFTGAYLLSVLARMAREREALTGLPVAVVMAAKLLPYGVMLADKPAFLRHREALVAAPEVFKVCLMVLALLGVLPLPRALMRSLSRSRGDVVVTGLLRPLLQHLRFRVHVWVVALEAAAMPCLFYCVVGSWRAVALRFGLSYGLSLAAGGALDWHARRQFAAEEGRGKAK
jgi:hypothetical protein